MKSRWDRLNDWVDDAAERLGLALGLIALYLVFFWLLWTLLSHVHVYIS